MFRFFVEINYQKLNLIGDYYKTFAGQAEAAFLHANIWVCYFDYIKGRFHIVEIGNEANWMHKCNEIKRVFRIFVYLCRSLMKLNINGSIKWEN